jgi:cell division protein FtsQ
MRKKATNRTSRKRNKRLSGRKRSRKNTAIRRAMAGAACLILGAALGAFCKLTADYIRHTPLFNITQVKVEINGSHITRQEILRLSGIREQRNIFSFHLPQTIQAIQFHPWVKTVSMRRQLPDQVIIEVQERKPYAIVAMKSLYYMDQDMEIFKKVMPWDKMDFPVITGLTLREVIENDPDLKTQLEKAVEILGLAQGSKVLPMKDLSEIHLDRNIGAQLWTKNHAVKIALGDSDYKRKWKELQKVILELDQNMQKVAVLDLNCEGRVTAKLKSGYKVARDESMVLMTQKE